MTVQPRITRSGDQYNAYIIDDATLLSTPIIFDSVIEALDFLRETYADVHGLEFWKGLWDIAKQSSDVVTVHDIMAEHNDAIINFNNYYRDDVIPGSGAGYGEGDHHTEGLWRVLAYATGSDYSGNLVEKSNYEIFTDEHDRDIVTLSGGYATFGVAVPEYCWNPDIVEKIEALSQYPLLDESHHSEMEMEAQIEAWNNCIMVDYVDAMAKIIKSDDLEYVPAFEDDLYEAFRDAADTANEYWINEEGSSAWIDVDPIAAATDIKQLLADGILVDNDYNLDDAVALIAAAMPAGARRDVTLVNENLPHTDDSETLERLLTHLDRSAVVFHVQNYLIDRSYC